MEHKDFMYQTYLMYGGDGDRIVDYEAFDEFELLLTRNNGTKEIFNVLDKTFRILNPDERDIASMSKDDYAREFGFRLTSKLRSSNITFDELAEKANISDRTLYGYLNGDRVPNFHVAVKLARALNCDINEFVRIPK